MRWLVRHGDILKIQADVLICSANVFLDLSGGVGGAFLLRYGPSMQEALHGYLAERGARHVERGTIVTMPSCGSPYRAVLHAVAVDGAYESSPAIVASVLSSSLHRAAAFAPRVVALTALATGYGRMPLADFAQALRQTMGERFPPIDCVTLGLRSRHDVNELVNLVPELQPFASDATHEGNE